MFLDSGFQYTSAIYVADETQRAAAEESVSRLTKEGRFPGAIKTPVEEAKTFWPAERYHQDYYRLNSTRYGFYRSLSGQGRVRAERVGAGGCVRALRRVCVCVFNSLVYVASCRTRRRSYQKNIKKIHLTRRVGSSARYRIPCDCLPTALARRGLPS